MSVIEVNNLVTLQAMAALTDWSGDSYIQTADIDASPTQDVNYGTPGDTSGVGDLSNGIGEGFIPISDGINFFNTNYDGQGFKITGSYINRPSVAEQSIFGRLDTGKTIKNLSVLDCSHEGYSHVTTLVGVCFGNIVNCHSSGEVVSNYNNAGGLCTKVTSSGKCLNSSANVSVDNNGGTSTGGFCSDGQGYIANCHAAGNVIGNSSYTGGFTGLSSLDTSIIINCHASGDVVGNGYSGGFVGWDRSLLIQDCYATGDVSGNVSNAGGFCGSIGNSVYGNRVVERCYSTGNVNQNWTQTGGFTGSLGSGDAEIKDCYCTGDVGISSHASDRNGGFVGLGSVGPTQIITDCYSTGKVWSSHANARGFAGASVANPTIASCYYDQTLSGKSDNDGHGEPVLDMSEKDNFINFDFLTIWKMLSVPMLRSLLNMNDAYSYGQNDVYGGDNNDAYENGDNDIYSSRLNRVY